MSEKKLTIGLALGSGSARGWAHFGVVRALREAGLEPQVVCGTSIGALVGAALASGDIDRLEEWARGLTWQTVLGLLDIGISGGLIKGRVITDFFREHFRDRAINDLPLRFGTVAADLASGQEIWLREGSLIDAVRASMAFPGLLAPIRHEGRLIVDGGLVNPVPVSMCRALGADIVIAVDLNSDLLGRHLLAPTRNAEEQPADDAKPAEPAGPFASVLGKLQSGLGRLRSGRAEAEPMPSIIDVLASSVNIMQVRITRSRLAGEPADILIQPRLTQVAFMDFHRAAVAIDEGYRATIAALYPWPQWAPPEG